MYNNPIHPFTHACEEIAVHISQPLRQNLSSFGGFIVAPRRDFVNPLALTLTLRDDEAKSGAMSTPAPEPLNRVAA